MNDRATGTQWLAGAAAFAAAFGAIWFVVAAVNPHPIRVPAREPVVRPGGPAPTAPVGPHEQGRLPLAGDPAGIDWCAARRDALAGKKMLLRMRTESDDPNEEVWVYLAVGTTRYSLGDYFPLDCCGRPRPIYQVGVTKRLAKIEREPTGARIVLVGAGNPRLVAAQIEYLD